MPDDTRSLGPDDEPTHGAGGPELRPTPDLDRIGPYKILETLGEGGMGIVYLAEQETPIRRRVALKLIKPGMDSRQVLARFESERQALALMNHPNVAKVLEAGATEQGRPYFVMEHVAGVPITEYCDTHLLTNRERLDLFLPICEAIQHAHSKGIIHRDIKPSNVLVALQDGKAVPKVIDFGVAKAVSQRLTEKTLFTEHGVLIGTPEYMSPEQAEMTALDVDSRTDIYSLGVLLYELLVGALPFDPGAIRRAGYAEMQRIIREEPTPTPSTRVTGLGAKAAELARRRRVDVQSLKRELRGDLDRIALKALEKDRTRRYSTANDLRDDLARHLRGERVLASPPSRIPAFRRLVKATPPMFPALVVLAGIVWVVSRSDLQLTLPSRQQLEWKYYDFLLSELQGGTPRTGDVAILAIDDDSYKAIGRDSNLPWPRGRHADLIRALKREGAKAVAFDILFLEAGADPAQDESLAAALSEAGNVVLGAAMEITEDPGLRQAQIQEPYEPFAKGAAAIGEVNLPTNKDGVIRFASLARNGRPSLALAAYETATGDRSLRDERVRLIGFAGPARTVPTISIYRALDPARYLPEGFFRGKTVFVGAALAAQKGTAPRNAFLTPFHGQTFGVEIHANIYESLCTKSWIVPCGPWAEWSILVVLAIAALAVGIAPWLLRLKILASAGLMILYGVLGAVAFIRFRYWLPMIGPAALIALALSVGVWFYRRRARARVAS